MLHRHLKSTIAALACIGGPASAEPVGPIPAIPTKLAIKAATAALFDCAEKGYRVTVTIVDRQGITRVQLVGDGAGPVSISTSRRKAYTSAALGMTTSDLGKLPWPPGPPIDPELITFAGGLPLISHGAVIGAIGVGGADRADKDEACAQVGLDVVRDMLD